MQTKLLLAFFTLVFPIICFSNETGIENLYLDLPKENTITIKKSVLFSGQVPNGYAVKINNELVQVKNNQFNKVFMLNKLGKHNYEVVFTSDEKVVKLNRNIIKLKYSSSDSLTQTQLGFINTDYVSNRFKYLPLKNQFQKTELAYFLNNFLSESSNDVTINNFSKLKYNKSEVQNVINNNVFSLNNKGDFNEFEAINTVILLASLRKTLKLKPSDKNYSELNQYKGSWFYNDLVIAFDNKLLSKSELNLIKQKLTNANFVKIASRLQQMQNAISSELQLNNEKNAPVIVNTKKPKSNKNLIKNINNKTIDIKISNIEQVSRTSKKIYGKTNLTKKLTANYRNIEINPNGDFELLVPLNQNIILFKYIGGQSLQPIPLSQEKETSRKVAKNIVNSSEKKEPIITKANSTQTPEINNYEDLDNHWVKEIANKLKKDAKLDQTANFNPKEIITREELAKHLVKINGVKANNLKTLNFNDVTTENPNYSYIQTVYSKNILNGIDKSTFAPKGNVTRIQALVVISRILPELKNDSTITLPFKDIAKYKWANKNLQKAYKYKVISPSEKLNPKNEITRAELITLLYKASNV